jgi:O-antigen/teichoic acid export membrane protein
MRRAFRQFVAASTSSIINKAIAAVASIVLARILEPEGFGLFSLVFSIVLLSDMFGDLGIDFALVKYASETENDADVVWTANILDIIFTLIAFTFCILASGPLAFYYQKPIQVLLIVCAFYLIPNCFTSFSSRLQARRRIGLLSALGVLNTLTRSILPIIFVLAGWGVTGAIIGYVISNSMASALGIYFGRTRGKFRIELAKKILRFGGFSAIGNISGYIVGNVDRILLGLFVTAEAIGYYSTATGLADLMGLVPAALYTVLFPIISRSYARNEMEKIKKIYRSGFIGLTIYVAIAAAGLIFVSRPLIQFFLGDNYLPSVWILRVAIIASGLGAISSIISVTLNGIGRPDINTRISLIHMIVLLVSLPILAMQMGAIGAVLAIILSRITWLLMGLMEAHRLAKIKIDRDAFRDFMGTIKEVLS